MYKLEPFRYHFLRRKEITQVCWRHQVVSEYDVPGKRERLITSLRPKNMCTAPDKDDRRRGCSLVRDEEASADEVQPETRS